MAIAVTGPAIQKELSITPDQWGWVLGAYVIAYAVFEVPSGALGDRHGYRRELTRITVWWSFFTAITALCRNFWQLAGARFMFGLGAAGAYPNITGVLRSEEHTSELQSLMRISYAVFCLKKKNKNHTHTKIKHNT